MLCFLSSHLVSDLAPTPSPLWKGTWAVDTYHGMFPMLATYFGKLDKKKKKAEKPPSTWTKCLTASTEQPSS